MLAAVAGLCTAAVGALRLGNLGATDGPNAPRGRDIHVPSLVGDIFIVTSGCGGCVVHRGPASPPPHVAGGCIPDSDAAVALSTRSRASRPAPTGSDGCRRVC